MENPVILIPGIQGTTLVNTNKTDFDKVWSALRKYYDNLNDLLLKTDGIIDVGDEIIIERSDVEDLAYNEIINYFRSSDYGLGRQTYIFGYDWRKSNLENGKELSVFIDKLSKKLGNPVSFDIVTHSMGALVFSGYLRHQQVTDTLPKAIHKVVFTVPPFLGSIEALVTLVIGKSALFNSSDDIRKVARTFPAIFELSAVYDGAFEYSPNTGQAFDIYNYDNWQQDADNDKYRELFKIRLASLKDARKDNNFIFDLSKLKPNYRQRLLILAGTNSDTLTKIRVKKQQGNTLNFFEFTAANSNNEGDGTVPLQSAEAFKDVITTLRVESRWLETRLDSRFITNDWHAFFLNNGRVQNLINKFLKENLAESNSQTPWYAAKDDSVIKV